MKRIIRKIKIEKAKTSKVIPRIESSQLVGFIIAKALEKGEKRNTSVLESPFASPRIALAVLEDLARQESGRSFPDTLLNIAAECINVVYDLAVIAEIASDRKNCIKCSKGIQDLGEQFDFALARVCRQVDSMTRIRARTSHNCDLLCDAIGRLVGDGAEAAEIIDRYMTLFPERDENGAVFPESWPDQFAWDTYVRMGCLDRMADKYPAYLTQSAQHMNAWPMLRYLHSDTKGRFELLADRLKLGARYPLNVEKNARYRPDTPMVAYLDSLVWKLHCFRLRHRKQEGDDSDAIERTWSSLETDWHKTKAAGLTGILRTALDLPTLTKQTAEDWAKKVIVPLIMVTDAKSAETCVEPAFARIWKQRRCGTSLLKSPADFKSRLQPDIVKTLKSMAKDGGACSRS